MDDDYRQAAALAALVAPYRHPRFSATKILADPNNLVSSWDGTAAEELRAEIERRLNILQEAGILELTAVPNPEEPHDGRR
jgi:hypothetical protein